MRIVNKKYNLKSNKTNSKIVLLSDIHYHVKKDLKYLNKIVDIIKLINPSYICICGDLTDEAYPNDSEYLIGWLTKLASICKVYLVLGNHEYFINRKKGILGINEELIAKIRKIDNLYLLENNNIVDNNINFCGLMMPTNYYEDGESIEVLNNYLDKINIIDNKYNILLFHSPINIVKDTFDRNYDLILCGHTHGGATFSILRPILKNRGLIDPNGHILPNNVYGKIKLKPSNLIITSGIRVLSNMNRFKLLKDIFPSEIVVIDINE